MLYCKSTDTLSKVGSEMESLTVGAVARLLAQPEYRVRRLVDALGVDIPRAGRYRLIPREMLPRIEEELERRAARRQARD